MANPNLLQATSSLGSWTGVIVGTSMGNVVTAPSSDNVRKVVSLYACNTTASSITLEMQVYNPGIQRTLVHELTIPANATVVIITKEAPIYLLESHTIQAVASASGIHVNVAYEDYS
jgi:hypothetical protein